MSSSWLGLPCVLGVGWQNCCKFGVAEAAGREAEQGCAMGKEGGKEPPAVGAKGSRWSSSSEGCAAALADAPYPPVLETEQISQNPVLEAGQSLSEPAPGVPWEVPSLLELFSSALSGSWCVWSLCWSVKAVLTDKSPNMSLVVFSSMKSVVFLAKLSLFAFRKNTASFVTGKSYRRR